MGTSFVLTCRCSPPDTSLASTPHQSQEQPLSVTRKPNKEYTALTLRSLHISFRLGVMFPILAHVPFPRVWFLCLRVGHKILEYNSNKESSIFEFPVNGRCHAQQTHFYRNSLDCVQFIHYYQNSSQKFKVVYTVQGREVLLSRWYL